ncbi:MAG: hypothetical protein MUP44_08560, partial [Anaerolineales bacterium]|nr:hypothetical protein [Anaerolineales bacterium]
MDLDASTRISMQAPDPPRHLKLESSLQDLDDRMFPFQTAILKFAGVEDAHQGQKKSNLEWKERSPIAALSL